MFRISLLAAGLALSGCADSFGPTFEEKLAGTWECTPETPPPGKAMTYTLVYKPDGQITGEMVLSEETEEGTAILRGDLSGTWKYEGKVLGHTMEETFKDLTVNGEVVPRDEVNPALIAGFRPEDSYDNPVDIVGEELVWYADAERKEIGARCAKGK